MKKILFILAILIGIYLLFIFLFQRKLIYFPAKVTPNFKAFHASDMQLVDLKTMDGLLLKSWYKAPLNKKLPIILYLHGNGGHIGFRMRIGRQILNAGFGLFLLEYRGYGGNEGNPTEKGLYSDARAAVVFLQKQGYSESDIVIYGESLGTAVATKLANEVKACSLILQSPFTSLSSVASYHYPWLPLKPKDKFDSYSRIKTISMPLLILHGDRDNVVPLSEADRLYKEAIEPKMMVVFPEKGHDDLWNKNFYKIIFQFIQTNCVKS